MLHVADIPAVIMFARGWRCFPAVLGTKPKGFLHFPCNNGMMIPNGQHIQDLFNHSITQPLNHQVNNIYIHRYIITINDGFSYGKYCITQWYLKFMKTSSSFNVYWPSDLAVLPSESTPAAQMAGWLSRRHQGVFFFRAAVRLELDADVPATQCIVDLWID